VTVRGPRVVLFGAGPTPAGAGPGFGRVRVTDGRALPTGVDRPVGSDRNRSYVPAGDVPFHQESYLSSYSPCLAAGPEQFGPQAGTSRSRCERQDPGTRARRVVDGLVTTGSPRKPETVWLPRGKGEAGLGIR